MHLVKLMFSVYRCIFNGTTTCKLVSVHGLGATHPTIGTVILDVYIESIEEILIVD